MSITGIGSNNLKPAPAAVPAPTEARAGMPEGTLCADWAVYSRAQISGKPGQRRFGWPLSSPEIVIASSTAPHGPATHIGQK